MISTLKITLLAFAALVAATPTSSNPADSGAALFAVEKRCIDEYYRCNADANDCCNGMMCEYFDACGRQTCISTREPQNPHCW